MGLRRAKPRRGGTGITLINPEPRVTLPLQVLNSATQTKSTVSCERMCSQVARTRAWRHDSVSSTILHYRTGYAQSRTGTVTADQKGHSASSLCAMEGLQRRDMNARPSPTQHLHEPWSPGYMLAPSTWKAKRERTQTRSQAPSRQQESLICKSTKIKSQPTSQCKYKVMLL